jgi:DNA-binding phage protein
MARVYKLPDRKLTPPKGPLNLNKSYNFVDKLPYIDKLRTIMEEADVKVPYVANKSGVCRETLYNWFSGKTRRPQAPTLNAVGRIFGKRLDWVDDK